ncbi:urease accessory protein UreF [Clostridium perfringens]|uniref:urease accessory protein UreF n=1 Tax=Clostridium perfringens TaxID=1502 RepID=UPI0024BC5CCE|nr:urease accessory protein UreF [Clostridium perfringens]
MSTTHINTNLKQILQVLQVCDSTFPIGSFNHSYGMETYLRDSIITNATSLEKWLNVFLDNQFVHGEGLAVALTYKYLVENDIEKIWELDRLMTVQTVAKEGRDGAKLVSYRMSELMLNLYDISLLKEYQYKIKKELAFGSPAIVFAIVMWNLKISLKEAVAYYGYSVVATLVQNAVRTIPLGQKDGQIILNRSLNKLENIYTVISKLDEIDLGANIPGLEISQINHEILTFRLFMS